MLSLGAFLIAVSSYQLLFWGEDYSHGLPLGRLTSTFSVVKTKNAKALDWRDAMLGSEVSENQMIYTDQDSSAQILFHQGDELQIDSNSLIKLESRQKVKTLEIERGSVKAKLEGKESLRVELRGREFVLKGENADIQFNVTSEKSEIGVLSGNITVQSGELQESLTAANSLIVKDGKVTREKQFFKQIEPNPQDIIFSDQDLTPLSFSWEPQTSAKVKISNSLDMKESQVIEGVPPFSHNLNEGHYYWKLESDQGSSLVKSFRIVREAPPRIIRPSPDERFYLLRGDETPKIHFQWEGEGKSVYDFEWDKVISHEEKVLGPNLYLPVDQTGVIRWRVRLSDEKRPKAIWTDWQRLEVAMVEKPLAPKGLFPHEVEYQSYDSQPQAIDLKWNSSLPVNLEIMTPDGKIVEKSISEQGFNYKTGIHGAYKWRVRSVDAWKQNSEWTEWMSFQVEDLRQEVLDGGIQRIQLKKPDQEVSFSWDGVDGEISVFELAMDKDFKNIVHKKDVQEETVKVPVLKTGFYYWRSRQFLPDGTINVSEPKKVIIEPIPAPLKPEKLPDLEIPLQWKVIEPKKSTFFNPFEWILPSAHAEDIKSTIVLDLPPAENAKSYVVRIFANQKLDQPVVEEMVSEPRYEWDGANIGTYYWQYAIMDHWGRLSPFSDISQLKVRESHRPQADKPKLITPIRAREVESQNLHFEWTKFEDHIYHLEISTDDNFQLMVFSQETRNNYLDLPNFPFKSGLHFWRIKSQSKGKTLNFSNTGRFVVLPPLEKIIISDQHVLPEQTPVEKEKKRYRFTFAWVPSLDEYSFKENNLKGEIQGNTLNSFQFKGSRKFSQGILSGEILRQSGEVFKSEEYLYQRVLLDFSWKLPSLKKLHFSAGPVLGQMSGQEYKIIDQTVKAKNLSGFGYGAILRGYRNLNKQWKAQGDFLYLAGVIKTWEVGGETRYHFQDFFGIAGINYSMRDYDLNSGVQSSLRFSLGIGKDF